MWTGIFPWNWTPLSEASRGQNFMSLPVCYKAYTGIQATHQVHFPSPRTPEVAVCFIESLSWMTALSSWPAWPSFPWCVKRKVSTGLWELNSTLLKVLSDFPEVKQIWPYPRSIPLAVPQTVIEFLDVLGKGIEASVMGWIRAISLAPSIFLLSPVACVFLSRLGTQSLFCWEHIRWSLWTYTIWIV